MDMDKKISKIAIAALGLSLVALIVSGIDVYFTHVHGVGVDLRIEHLSGEYIEQYDDELKFYFDLHNNGNEHAFIENIYLQEVLGSGKETHYSRFHNFEKDKNLDIVYSKSTLRVNVTLDSPGVRDTKEFKIYVYYDPDFQHITSESFIVRWT